MNVKILFRLEGNSEGYPPIEYELLNGTVWSENSFRIENAPFFTQNISYHDIVSASESEVSGQFHFLDVIEASTFTSISIIILDKEMDTFLMDLLRGFSCVIEYGEFGNFRVLAVAVPASIDYQQLRNQLQHFEDQSKISFAELAVAHD